MIKRLLLWACSVLTLAVFAAAPATAAPTTVEWGSNAQIDAYITQARNNLRLPGLTIVLLRDGKPYFNKSYGDASPGKPMTADTPVEIGSTSKQFTALAIQELVAEHRLKLDSTAHQLLPYFGSGADDLSQITIAELLAHTSGFSVTTGVEQWGWWFDQPTSIDGNVRKYLAHARLDRKPGSTFEYSNANYDLLGAVIEKVTGKPFATAVDDLVFKPMGLTHTTGDLVNALPHAATGYYTWLSAFTVPTPAPLTPGSVPSARIISTANDLTKVVEAHLGSQPTRLRNGLLATVRQPLSTVSANEQYASGWMVRNLWELSDNNALADNPTARAKLPTCVEHGGATDRTLTQMLACPTMGFGVVAVTNVGIGTDEDKFARFTDGLNHVALGTKSGPYYVQRLVAYAPLILPALVVLQLVSALMLVRAVVRRSLVLSWGIIAGIVSVTQLWIGYGFAPNYGQRPMPHLWAVAPDLAVATITASVLSVMIAITCAAGFVRRHRD